MLLADLIQVIENTPGVAQFEFHSSALRELKHKQVLLGELHHLNRLLSICDMIAEYHDDGKSDQIYGLIATIVVMAEACHQSDKGLSEEGVNSHMNTYAANCIRKMLRNFALPQPQMGEMLKYAQSIEDNG